MEIEQLCTISTPQHSQKPNPSGAFADYEWVYNKEKGCYETFFWQSGRIDLDTWLFTPASIIKGMHQVQFKSKEDFLKAKV